MLTDRAALDLFRSFSGSTYEEKMIEAVASFGNGWVFQGRFGLDLCFSGEGWSRDPHYIAQRTLADGTIETRYNRIAPCLLRELSKAPKIIGCAEAA